MPHQRGMLVRNSWCGTSNVVKTLGPRTEAHTPSLGRERAAYRLCLPAGAVKPPNLFMANKNALRAVLRPGGRLNLWCAVDCARGWPGGYGHPDPSHCLPGAHRSPDRLPTRQREASPGVILFVSQQASPLSSPNCDPDYCSRISKSNTTDVVGACVPHAIPSARPQSPPADFRESPHSR